MTNGCASDPQLASEPPKRACPQPATLDDHSEAAPPLPIPNRTVKRLSADDSGCTSVKVGHRQALIPPNPRPSISGGLAFTASEIHSKTYAAFYGEKS